VHNVKVQLTTDETERQSLVIVFNESSQLGISNSTLHTDTHTEHCTQQTQHKIQHATRQTAVILNVTQRFNDLVTQLSVVTCL